MSIVRMPLLSIIADDGNQPRTDDLDDAYVDQLAEIPEQWPPLTVVPHTEGAYWLVDGFHRLEAASRLGLDTVLVSVSPMPADGDLATLGFNLNAKHGRPLTLADRRRQAQRLLERDPRQSDRSISERCGIAASTVARIREQLVTGAQIEQSAERVGSDGRTYRPPDQKPGELPDKSLGQFVGDGIAGILDPKSREKREVARYLQRLLVALEDSRQFEVWATTQDAVSACVEVLGMDRAQKLAADLTPLLYDVIDGVDTIAPAAQ
jgi:hypothetical protein